MKAVRLHQFGGPEVLKLEDGVPVPKCGETEVLVKVMSVGVNPVETYIRAGHFPIKPQFPMTLGGDCAGVVVQTGSKVAKFKVGDRVWSCQSLAGVYAEYCALDQTKIWPLPSALTFSQGAALGIPYLTAYRALFTKAQAKPGQTLLIHGASGAVGIAAVQIARAYGLTVIGTAGTPEGCTFVEKTGAHKAFNHKEADYSKGIMAMTSNEGVDIVLEMLADVNLQKDLDMIKQGGQIMIIGSRGNIKDFSPGQILMKEAKVTGILLLVAKPEEFKESGAGIVAGMEAGWLRPVVEKEYPLAQASQVHHDIIATGGRTGKLVMCIAKA
jgi:NADPH2:quinone reductase